MLIMRPRVCFKVGTFFCSCVNAQKLNMQAEEAVIIIYILASHCVRVPVSVYVVIMSAKIVKEKKPRSLVKLGHVRFVNYLE